MSSILKALQRLEKDRDGSRDRPSQALPDELAEDIARTPDEPDGAARFPLRSWLLLGAALLAVAGAAALAVPRLIDLLASPETLPAVAERPAARVTSPNPSRPLASPWPGDAEQPGREPLFTERRSAAAPQMPAQAAAPSVQDAPAERAAAPAPVPLEPPVAAAGPLPDEAQSPAAAKPPPSSVPSPIAASPPPSRAPSPVAPSPPPSRGASQGAAVPSQGAAVPSQGAAVPAQAGADPAQEAAPPQAKPEAPASVAAVASPRPGANRPAPVPSQEEAAPDTGREASSPAAAAESQAPAPAAAEPPSIEVAAPEAEPVIEVAPRPEPTPPPPVAARPPPPQPEPRPEPAAEVAEPVAPRAQEPPPAPRVAVVRTARPIVHKTVWHPLPARRLTEVSLEEEAERVELREGDSLAGLVVERIEPSGVVFRDGDRELRRPVGSN